MREGTARQSKKQESKRELGSYCGRVKREGIEKGEQQEDMCRRVQE